MDCGMADELGSSRRAHGDDGVAVVTLDNGKVNALSTALLAELHGSPPSSTADPPGAVVITGGERIFAAGADISEFGGPDEAAPITAAFHAALDAVAAIPRVVIAAVSRLRARRRLRARAGLRLPDRRRAGRVRPARDPARHHPRRRWHAAAGPAGRAQPAKDIMLTGRQVDAEEALRIGLADEVVPDDGAPRRALALAAECARGALVAQALAKQAIDRGLDGVARRRPRARAGAVRRGRSAPTTPRSASRASSNTAPARPSSPGPS